MIGLTLETHLTMQQREWLNISYSSSEFLLGIINDILSLTKIQALKITLEVVSYDFTSLLQSITNLANFQASEKGLKLFLDIDPKLPQYLLGDQLRLRQIITNILGNSVKFTERGHIIFHAKHEVFQNKEYLYFEIEDTGIGIAEDKIDSIFEKFTQENSSTTRQYGGTGLGLAISKELVEMMGGTVRRPQYARQRSGLLVPHPLSSGYQSDGTGTPSRRGHARRALFGSEPTRP